MFQVTKINVKLKMPHGISLDLLQIINYLGAFIRGGIEGGGGRELVGGRGEGGS